MTEDHKQGFFYYDKLQLGKIEASDVVKIKAKGMEESKPTKVRYISKTDNNNPHFFLTFQGVLRTLPSGNGLVNMIFVPNSLCAGKHNGSHIAGKAIISYDKKKEKWGWKAISVN